MTAAEDTSPPRIWSTIIDTKARETPGTVFCEILESEWREKGSRKITFAQFSRAVNRACWWLQQEFGPSKDFDSFTYVGDNDLRYTIMMVAAQKSERTMVIAELNRLTHPALLLLLEDTKCFRWLGGSEAHTASGNALPDERSGTKLTTLPPLEYWLEDGDVLDYTFDKSWDEARMNVCFVIHSSGTTGIPKPLRYTLEMFAVADFVPRFTHEMNENPKNMFEPMLGTRVFWGAPPLWLGGVVGQLMAPMFWDIITIWPPVHEGTPTPASVVSGILEKFRPDGAFFVPSTLRDLSAQQTSLELVKKLNYVMYGGAPLDGWVGDLLCTELNLLVLLGFTETNIWPLHKLEDPKEWRYYRIDDRIGHRLEHFRDDLHELVIDRKPEHRRYQGAFMMFPGTDTWHSQPDLIQYRGRKDDLVKLVWLTKVRAGDMESALSSDARITETMVGGEGRPTPFIILQLAESIERPSEEELWTIVRTLNEKFSAELWTFNLEEHIFSIVPDFFHTVGFAFRLPLLLKVLQLCIQCYSKGVIEEGSRLPPSYTPRGRTRIDLSFLYTVIEQIAIDPIDPHGSSSKFTWTAQGPFAVPELAGGNDPVGTPAQPTGTEARRTIAVSALLAEHVLTVQAAAEREMEILIAHGDGWAESIFEQFDIEPDSSLEIGVGWRDR
ncbi:hypothetical protein SCUP515_01788 [Seiridium cupressi]